MRTPWQEAWVTPRPGHWKRRGKGRAYYLHKKTQNTLLLTPNGSTDIPPPRAQETSEGNVRGYLVSEAVALGFLWCEPPFAQCPDVLLPG